MTLRKTSSKGSSAARNIYESYKLNQSRTHVTRVVKLFEKSYSTTIPLVSGKSKHDPDDAFDKSWLQLREKSHDSRRPDFAIADLFCGCGGLTIGGLEAAEAFNLRPCVSFSADIDECALSVYRANLSPGIATSTPIEVIFPFKNTKPDAKTALPETVDLLIGGPPCQGHSDLNNHTRRDDPRNDLYSVMARAAKRLSPKLILIENVPGVRHSKSKVVERTLTTLEGLGYKLHQVVLNAADFGVAQSRKRHFVLGTTGDIDILKDTIEALRRPQRNVLWAIDDLDSEEGGSTFDTPATHSATNSKRISYLFKHQLYELPDSQRPDCHKLKEHTYKSVYGRMYPDKPAPTITSGFGSTGQGRFVHPHKPRTLTPHEAARIQFFPDWFSFGDAQRRNLQKLIGNAVPPKLGYALALALIASIKAERK